MLPRRPTDSDGDNLAMAVNDGSSHEGTSVSDTTVNLRVGLIRMQGSIGRHSDDSDHN
jgi:hypothetical protein